MYLKNENLVVRPANKNDAQTLCNWWSDGDIMAHAGFPNGIQTDIDELINRLNSENDGSRILIIEVNSNRIGEMSYQVEDSIAEIGIKICNFTYQEKGYGTKALKILIKYLLDVMKVKKIILDTNINNTRAQHVYENIGFKKTTVRLDSWKDQLGVLQSYLDFELEKEDFIE